MKSLLLIVITLFGILFQEANSIDCQATNCGNAPTITKADFDCSNIVFKESEGVLNWLGNVTFTVPVSTTNAGWIGTLKFDQMFTGIGVWDVTIENFGDDKYSIIHSKPENHVLNAGDKFSFRFRINYGRDIPQPILTSFSFLDIELCA